MGRPGLVAALALTLAACAPRPSEPPRGGGGDRPPARAPAPAAIHVAGEERGYLEPCGCTRPQLGGLARKGTALSGSPLLENGDLVDRPGRLSELKFETFLLALSEIGCRALNVGEGDLELGFDFLRSAAGLAGFPLVSANIPGPDGGLVFAPFADFEHAGTKVRAVGVLDPALAGGRRLLEPEKAVERVLRETPEGVRVILMFHGRREGAERLLDRFPRIAVAVSGHGNGEPVVHSPRHVDPGDRSRWLVRLGPPPEIVELTESIPDDRRMLRAMKTYVRRLTEEDLLHRMNPQAPPPGGGYAGDRACATCHEKAARIHKASRHAKAIEVLEKTGRHVDPDCVKCHVIGYGERSGFTSVAETPALARVGCESCHGAAKAHAEDPTTGRPQGNARKSCVTCHNADTDPHFDRAKKWKKIRH